MRTTGCGALQRRCTIVRCGDVVEILRTMGRVEHLSCPGTQPLDVFPSPRGAIGHPTQPHRVFGHHARLFDLLERLAKLVLSWPLMPPEHMDTTIPVEEREAKAFGVTPLPAPLRAFGPSAPSLF